MSPEESHNHHKSGLEIDPKQAIIGYSDSPRAHLGEALLCLGELETLQFISSGSPRQTCPHLRKPSLLLGEEPIFHEKILCLILGEETSSKTQKSNFFSSPNRPLTKSPLSSAQKLKVSQGRKNPLPLGA